MCKRCLQRSNQICHLSNVGFFSVNKALRILRENPRKAEELSNRNLDYYTRKSRILKESKRHLNHVNKEIPIIIGNTNEDSFIVDGNHRALYNRLNGHIRTYAYILTEFETGQIFRKNPPAGKQFK